MLPASRMLWFCALFDGGVEVASKSQAAQPLPTAELADVLPLVGVLGTSACHAVIDAVARIYKATADREERQHRVRKVVADISAWSNAAPVEHDVAALVCGAVKRNGLVLVARSGCIAVTADIESATLARALDSRAWSLRMAAVACVLPGFLETVDVNLGQISEPSVEPLAPMYAPLNSLAYEEGCALVVHMWKVGGGQSERRRRRLAASIASGLHDFVRFNLVDAPTRHPPIEFLYLGQAPFRIASLHHPGFQTRSREWERIVFNTSVFQDETAGALRAEHPVFLLLCTQPLEALALRVANERLGEPVALVARGAHGAPAAPASVEGLVAELVQAACSTPWARDIVSELESALVQRGASEVLHLTEDEFVAQFDGAPHRDVARRFFIAFVADDAFGIVPVPHQRRAERCGPDMVLRLNRFVVPCEPQSDHRLYRRWSWEKVLGYKEYERCDAEHVSLRSCHFTEADCSSLELLLSVKRFPRLRTVDLTLNCMRKCKRVFELLKALSRRGVAVCVDDNMFFQPSSDLRAQEQTLR